MAAPVALVTGGGKRVGATLVRTLAARGFSVAVHYHSSRQEAEALATSLGNGARAFCANLADPAAPSRLIGEVVAALGGLDVLVNSAASFLRTPLDRVTTADWDAVFAVNLRAPFFLSIEAAKHMTETGVIINIADLAAFEGWPNYVPHGAAKAGVVQITRALARQLAPRIRVNAIVPGVVLLPEGTTAQESGRLAATTPLRRHGTPVDVARAMTYLLDATFVTGELLFVDGGRHVRV